MTPAQKEALIPIKLALMRALEVSRHNLNDEGILAFFKTTDVHAFMYAFERIPVDENNGTLI